MDRKMLYVVLIIVLLPYSAQTAPSEFKVPWMTTLAETAGSDVTLECLPPNPRVTNFTLQKADGSELPPGLNYTADPKLGIVIRSLRLDYSGKYVCSANLQSEQLRSAEFHIYVRKRVDAPPSVYVEMDEYVAVVGETLQIYCYIKNPDHTYSATWNHSASAVLDVQTKINNCTDLTCSIRVLTLTKVNMSNAGNLTCSSSNNVGTNAATVSLRVVERPYLLLRPMLQAGASNVGVNLMEGEKLSLKVGVDAHPAVAATWWDTPGPQSTSTYQQTFTSIHRSYRREASFLLRRVRADESGWYIFHARSTRANASARFQVHVYQKPTVKTEWKNGSLMCIASGYPPPNITWHQCEKLTASDGCDKNLTSTVTLPSSQHTVVQSEHDQFHPQHVESVFPRTPPLNTTIQCEAVNIAGEERSSFTIEHPYFRVSAVEPKRWISQIFITIVSSASVVAALLLLLLGVSIYKCKQKPKYEIRWKIVEINDGNNYTYVDPTQLPYNAEWEFPRDRLTFGQVLGAGAFGKVVEATAYGLEKDDHVTRVAVKMLKPSAHSEEKEALMCELKILSHLGSHANIVNLLGACTRQGPVLLITEYCSQGDLLNFLRRRASLLIDSTVRTPRISSMYRNISDHQNHEHNSAVNSYVDMRAGWTTDDHTQKDPSEVKVDHLVRFSSQVAHGMDFLSSKNCIHRDIAARNVLITDTLVAKICDFGLARDIMNDSDYVVRGNARLPVKWMSPESIFHCLYTVQSDVWSYGVLLWEIFSLGRSPYPQLKVDARFYQMIKSGYHMSQPDFAPPEIYKVMKTCWSLEPTSRPTFNKIVQIISRLQPETSEMHQYKNLRQELEQKLSLDCVSDKANEELVEEQRPLTLANNYQIY